MTFFIDAIMLELLHLMIFDHSRLLRRTQLVRIQLRLKFRSLLALVTVECLLPNCCVARVLAQGTCQAGLRSSGCRLMESIILTAERLAHSFERGPILLRSLWSVRQFWLLLAREVPIFIKMGYRVLRLEAVLRRFNDWMALVSPRVNV